MCATFPRPSVRPFKAAPCTVDSPSTASYNIMATITPSTNASSAVRSTEGEEDRDIAGGGGPLASVAEGQGKEKKRKKRTNWSDPRLSTWLSNGVKEWDELVKKWFELNGKHSSSGGKPNTVEFVRGHMTGFVGRLNARMKLLATGPDMSIIELPIRGGEGWWDDVSPQGKTSMEELVRGLNARMAQSTTGADRSIDLPILSRMTFYHHADPNPNKRPSGEAKQCGRKALASPDQIEDFLQKNLDSSALKPNEVREKLVDHFSWDQEQAKNFYYRVIRKMLLSDSKDSSGAHPSRGKL